MRHITSDLKSLKILHDEKIKYSTWLQKDIGEDYRCWFDIRKNILMIAIA